MAEVSGKFMNSGPAALSFKLLPVRPGPDFDLAVQIDEADLRTMNDMLRAYGKFDVVAGRFSLYTELRARNRQVSGYVKPLFQDMQVYDPSQDRDKNVFRKAYEAVARGASREDAELEYRPTVPLDADDLAAAFLGALAERRREEVDRGLTLVGPHRDDLLLTLAPTHSAGEKLPVKGYASHGESWSFALAMRLASYDLLRSDGDDPILVLDDVFAELDAERRAQLADLVAGAEQVLVTAAVPADVPAALSGARFVVSGGEVTRDEVTGDA